MLSPGRESEFLCNTLGAGSEFLCCEFLCYLDTASSCVTPLGAVARSCVASGGPGVSSCVVSSCVA